MNNHALRRYHRTCPAIPRGMLQRRAGGNLHHVQGSELRLLRPLGRPLREGIDAEVAVSESTDMGSVKDANGVPARLRSCHTMIVDGYVIEGHVPAADIARLLEERPESVRGLAVPGMPIGSPGMEMGERTQPYQVIAFGDAGLSVYASYN